MKNILFILFILLFNTINCQNKPVKDFKITILSTMLSDFYTGEWGFSALIELDGKKILFDTGSREQTVIKNAEELGINLNNIDNVFLSHKPKLMRVKEQKSSEVVTSKYLVNNLDF